MAKYKTKVEIVYESLIKDITKGIHKPGDRLVISQISKQHNMSDIPVREAIRNLESEGYVTVLANQGAVINSFDKKTLSSIFEVKAVLEGFAALQSINHITPKIIRKLYDLNDQMYSMLEEDNHKKHSQLNVKFHLEIYSCIPNQELYRMIEDLWKKWCITRTVFDIVPESALQSIEEHKVIIKMLEEKNYAEIEMFVRNHKLRAGTHFIGNLPDPNIEAI
ncbi:MAG: GntR family transcriptional regulator [Lachnospiraceae bacterium]